VDEKYEAMHGGRADLKAAIDPVRELHPTVYHTDDESDATHSTCHQRQRGCNPSPSAGRHHEEPTKFWLSFFFSPKNKKDKRSKNHHLYS